MPSEEAIALAASHRGLVIAPAGCGKTYLLAEAVSCSRGRQLVLTHTHAGVRAIRGHLERQGVPSAKYSVITIDGLALRYASSFPTLSGWTTLIPNGDDWKKLRVASHQVFQRKAIHQVLLASYSGIFVDEYQDCSLGQHQMILALGEIMPVRIVGDPLQAIFALLDQEDFYGWHEVEKHFTTVAELSQPHRWRNRNEALGTWLLDVRRRLIAGEEINLQQAPLVLHLTTAQKEQDRLKACFGVKAKTGETQVGLRKWGNECHRLARYLRGRYRSMETVECDELLKWSDRIEASTGIERVQQVFAFAELCVAGFPTAVKDFGRRLAQGAQAKPRRTDYKRVLQAAEAVRDSLSLNCVLDLLAALIDVDHRLVRARDELWREMKRTIREHQASPSSSLRQTAWNIRNRLRHIGSKVDRAALGTPLLVKGLEFDHAVVIDAADHGEAESLYVALTRGSRSLTVLSDDPIVRRGKPRFVVCNGSSAQSANENVNYGVQK